MKFNGTLIVVKDIDKAVNFYKEVLGLRVTNDFGANKKLTGGIFLQTLDTWIDFIHTDKVTFGGSAVELYFEEDNMDVFLSKLDKREDIRYVHKVKEHDWGQRAVRIYDLDGHILEIGENLKSVAKRFEKEGMTTEEVAARMDIPLKYAKQLLK